MNGKVHVMDHPLVAHKLTILRDKDTSVKDFREIVSEIGMLITYEATRDLPLTEKEVETPICKTTAPTLKGKKFAVVPPGWVTSACSVTRKPWSLMSISASFPKMWPSGISWWWTPCWPPAAVQMPPSPL